MGGGGSCEVVVVDVAAVGGFVAGFVVSAAVSAAQKH